MLIVEDEVLVRLHAADVLLENGFHVLEAAHARQALSILETGAPVDVLFTDVNMPGDIDGLDLARLVRVRWPQIRILITSGRSWPQLDRTQARFVAKPYMPDQVVQAISAMVGQRTELHCAVG